jgi:hypothetical protein
LQAPLMLNPRHLNLQIFFRNVYSAQDINMSRLTVHMLRFCVRRQCLTPRHLILQIFSARFTVHKILKCSDLQCTGLAFACAVNVYPALPRQLNLHIFSTMFTVHKTLICSDLQCTGLAFACAVNVYPAPTA